jgi:hypothetical protein
MIRQVRATGQLSLLEGEWEWEHRCPECGLQGQGQEPAAMKEEAA